MCLASSTVTSDLAAPAGKEAIDALPPRPTRAVTWGLRWSRVRCICLRCSSASSKWHKNIFHQNDRMTKWSGVSPAKVKIACSPTGRGRPARRRSPRSPRRRGTASTSLRG